MEKIPITLGCYKPSTFPPTIIVFPVALLATAQAQRLGLPKVHASAFGIKNRSTPIGIDPKYDQIPTLNPFSNFEAIRILTIREGRIQAAKPKEQTTKKPPKLRAVLAQFSSFFASRLFLRRDKSRAQKKFCALQAVQDLQESKNTSGPMLMGGYQSFFNVLMIWGCMFHLLSLSFPFKSFRPQEKEVSVRQTIGKTRFSNCPPPLCQVAIQTRSSSDIKLDPQSTPSPAPRPLRFACPGA